MADRLEAIRLLRLLPVAARQWRCICNRTRMLGSKKANRKALFEITLSSLPLMPDEMRCMSVTLLHSTLYALCFIVCTTATGELKEEKQVMWTDLTFCQWRTLAALEWVVP